MNDEQFDKEINSLYQQRKSQLINPHIDIPIANRKKNYSLVKLVSLFTVGGVASFTIMALMSHFAKSPEAPNTNFTTSHQINLSKENVEELTDEVVVIKNKLPSKPNSVALASGDNLLTPTTSNVSATDISKIKINALQKVKLPSLKPPELTVKPVRTVMPKYSHKSLQNRQSGSITLRYNIDATGSVKNIEVVTSEVDRALQRSAKKALSKWQYKASDHSQKHHEIMFEFNLEAQ